MSTRGQTPSANISTEGHQISMLHKLSRFIYIVVWPTTKIWN